MTGVIITFNGKQNLNGIEYGFSVQSGRGDLPNLPDIDAPLRPADPPFQDLAGLVSDPDRDTPHLISAGQSLHALLNQHQNTTSALLPTLQAPLGTPGRDIRLCIPDFADDMRNLPWETLYDPGRGFLDNDQGVPILRMHDPKPGAMRPPPMLPADGLQIVSVIAADSIDGFDEYRALMGALAVYDKPWHLHVFTPDDSVRTAIQQAGDPKVHLHKVPDTATDLMQKIAGIAPQVCHFFCHGVATGAGPASLELSTVLSNMGRTTVEVKPFQLAGTLPSSCWLVLLNACNSGMAPGDSGSLAGELVENGVPVVVGMREPTQTKTLNTFTEGFLNDALPVMSNLLDQNAPAPLELGTCLTAARNAICAEFRRHGADPAKRMKDWSLPVMVVSSDAFALETGTATDFERLAELESQRKTLADFLDRTGAQLSEVQQSMIKTQIAELDQDIMAQLT